MESMGSILKHILLAIVFNLPQAPDFLPPDLFRKLKVSVAEVRLYMKELILAHMQSSSFSTPSTIGTRPASLIEAIVTANEFVERGDSERKPRSYFAGPELYGNIFVLILGGYRSTAETRPLLVKSILLTLWIELLKDWRFEVVMRIERAKGKSANRSRRC